MAEPLTHREMTYRHRVPAGSPHGRREFLRRSAALAAAIAASVKALPAQTDERLIDTLPLAAPNAVPLERMVGRGLDARLFTDLSTLTESEITVPADRFYVRTARPARLPDARTWTIGIGASGADQSVLRLERIQERSRDMGVVLLECSGNGDPNNFGLLSAAPWAGTPVMEALQDVRTPAGIRHLLVSGVDDPSSPSGTSVPGASWIFPIEQLADAFFAVGMNGRALTPDHGAPLRLVVPGWYGCACIKWVDRLEFVPSNTPATPHMREFAERTHQAPGVSTASDFAPAVVEHAAIPVRVERWQRGSERWLRVVGILWGGAAPTNRLEIRFRPDEPFVPVESCPLPQTTRSWTLWTHRWRPSTSGRYEIRLRVADPRFRTLRLNAGFYRRFVIVPTV